MKAALVCINFETGEILYTPYEGEKAIDHCHALKKSIEGDWPGFEWGVIADEEARQERVDRILGVIPTD